MMDGAGAQRQRLCRRCGHFGKAALQRIEERRPDLLIRDLNVPEPEGFDVLKIERSQFPSLRILVSKVRQFLGEDLE